MIRIAWHIPSPLSFLSFPFFFFLKKQYDKFLKGVDSVHITTTSSAICTFSFRFPAFFGGFWGSRNLKTRNLETLKESLKASRKYLKITSVLKSLIIFWFFFVYFMSNHSS